jgi:hypothetical protein
MLSSELATNGIHNGEYGQSIGLSMDDEHLAGLEHLQGVFDDMHLQGWSRTGGAKNGVLFLKLKIKDDKYSFKSKSKFDPKHPELSGLESLTPVDVIVTVGAYFHNKDKKYGLTFTVDSLDIADDDFVPTSDFVPATTKPVRNRSRKSTATQTIPKTEVVVK